VFDITPGDPFGSSRSSYFHKAIGGYHGAKMRRYQEVYDHHIKEGIDDDVLDMLNTKYIIQRDPQTGKPTAVRRTSNLGNAWFVSDVKVVENADEEIEELGKIDPAKTVLVDKRYDKLLNGYQFKKDSMADIELTDYSPNRLEYKYSTSTTQIGVFSEIYYSKGWKAYINGEEVPYFRVNYILRGMVIEPGEGTIVFEFKPAPYTAGASIALAGSIILVLIVIGGIFYAIKKERQ
jgi:hypothetical protein